MTDRAVTFRLPTIRSALEFRREQYGWTARQMATALGIANSHYSEIIHGKRGLPYHAACKAFEIGIPAEVLLQTRKTKREYERRNNGT
jgi:transcriptional regulator with XRE-family HTH domain